MGVNHRGRNILVAQQLLDRPDVGTGLMCRKRVAERGWICRLGDRSFPGSAAYGALKEGRMDVMPAHDSRTGIRREARSRLDPEPTPLRTRSGIFSGQRPRNLHSRNPEPSVSFME
jgi:hypothetical protein